jgi:acid stress-induced BolA-like protein IbaG/YrbA
MQNQQLVQTLQTEFPDAHIEVEGDGYHYQVIIVSAKFKEKSRVLRSQMVYQSLGAAITQGDLHAISMKTFTPEEWEASHG